MSKAAPPLLGFNNNVRHRGRIFHIQTEDSGVKFPRIVTHLFADGGRIVKTTRTDYTEHLEKPDMAAVVRGMMKEQHKAMFAALRAGDMDPLLETVCGPLDAAKPRAPEAATDPTSSGVLESARVVVASVVPAEPSNLPIPVAPSLQLTQPAPDAIIESMKSLRDTEDPRGRRPISNPNLRKPTPSVTPPVGEGFELDVASLDQNPPKPSRTPGPPPSARPPRKSNPAPRKSRPPIPQRPAPAAAGAAAAPAEGAGALGRPQTRHAAAPPPSARSIFGDGAISEQSLDEVILSYLAEDLEEPK
ncbi:MAG: hypothetical protein EOO73_17780 [Myxococcales bacterium]|nr:MAG: hypothetical protein EOO73_17780 [Myxococcales bacterium]